MQNEIQGRIESILKMNEDDQTYLLRYFSKLPIDIRLSVLQRHRTILYRLKESSNEYIELISYSAQILAIKSFYVEEQKMSAKKFNDMSLEEIRNLSLIKLKKYENKLPTATPQRDKLLHYWSVVKMLKEKGKGSRNISKFLKKEYRFEVSHMLINELWNELERETI